jgi:hypothetical protein
MAYKIFFSGLMVFVRYKAYEQVDVLLLNPCAQHHGAHATAQPPHVHARAAAGDVHDDDDASCLDRHLPQMTIRAADMAAWNLAGTVHGCGSRHFDVTGKTIFNKVQVPDNYRQVQVPDPDPDDLGVTYTVGPFGDMRHVSFKRFMPDLCQILGNGNGKIDLAKVVPMLNPVGKGLIATRVRLPAGKLTAFAPVDTSARQIVNWEIGKQKLAVMAETAMFEPSNRDDHKITVGDDEYVTLRNKRDEEVEVWITAEPRRRTRADARELAGAQHFQHYYELLPQGIVTPGAGGKVASNLLPKMAFNVDTPPCPGSQGCTDPPLP